MTAMKPGYKQDYHRDRDRDRNRIRTGTLRGGNRMWTVIGLENK